MRILHYSLGFPPYRSGGLTKFCFDLMQEEQRAGHEVSLLWPGEIGLLSNQIRVKQHKNVYGIESYEIINPLPISFDEGINNFKEFKKDGGEKAYNDFLAYLAPEVIHLHTLMGIHKSFFEVAKDIGIRLVFTTHDFFPICPRVKMYRNGAVCSTVSSCDNCSKCNSAALSLGKIRVLQSPVYRRYKDSFIVKSLRTRHRESFFSQESYSLKTSNVGNPTDYLKLRSFYQDMLSYMDIIHFNSNISKMVYEKYLEVPKSVVISITHADISNHKKIRLYNSEILRIRYLGPQSGAKGYYILLEALDRLWEEKHSFRLDVHFSPIESRPYMCAHPRYEYSQLASLFDDTDVLVCPSIWYETFGFTVLESLSYGVPVLVSENVGAKDILEDGAGVVMDGVCPKVLYDSIKILSNDTLSIMNKKIVEKQNIPTIDMIAQKIYEECYVE